MKLTNFELVSNMNAAFGNPKGNSGAIDLDKLKSQCKNILDEYNELLEAIEAKDFYKIRDALCDIHVFAYGAHHLMGLNADEDMHAVVEAVMTRFIKDPADLHASIETHRAKGVLSYYTEGHYPRMILKSSCDQPDAPRGKFLKSASYREPTFGGLCFQSKPVEGWAATKIESNWGFQQEQFPHG